MNRYRATRLESTLPGKDLPVADQRIFLDAWTPVCLDPEVAAPDAEAGADGLGGAPATEPTPEPVPTSLAKEVREPTSPTKERPGSPTKERPGSPSPDRPGSPSHARPASPPPVGTGAHSEAAVPAQGALPPSSVSSLLKLLERIIDPTIARGVVPQPLILRAGSKGEHELLHSQVLCSLARELRDGEAQMGAVRLVPLPISMSKIAEYMADEAMVKRPPRELLIKAFEAEYPGYGEMIKQAGLPTGHINALPS
jgi:hypothetical protein